MGLILAGWGGFFLSEVENRRVFEILLCVKDFQVIKIDPEFATMACLVAQV